MPSWKEGDRVRVVSRTVTAEDRKSGRYFEHMAGLVGTVQSVYSPDEVAVKVDPECLGEITSNVHATAVQRMRDKFLSSIGEEQKKTLTKEELAFNAHFVLLVRSTDLEPVSV